MNRPINEQDEFLLSRLLDEDLPADEAAALRSRMEREPELRKAYTAITRIDSLLAARRADQPQIDWSVFNRRVMDQVKVEAAGRHTIRLADFLRIALPLAAAAAITLAVWLWPHSGQVNPGGGVPTQHIAVAPRPLPTVPGAAQRDSGIVVQYHPLDTSNIDDIPRVTYARSDELSKEYRAMDEKNRSRESEQSLLTGNTSPSQSVPNDLSEASPLF